MQISWVMTSYTQPRIHPSNIWKLDISTNLYQKWLILVNKTLLGVRYYTRYLIMSPWQHTGFHTSPMFEAFLASFGVSFWYFFTDALFARSSKHINVFKVDYFPWFNFSGLKSTKILKTTRRTGKESVAMEPQFNYIRKWVTFGTISVSSFNGFCRKLIEIQCYIGLSRWRHQSPNLHILAIF